jgi:hypothetical protein
MVALVATGKTSRPPQYHSKRKLARGKLQRARRVCVEKRERRERRERRDYVSGFHALPFLSLSLSLSLCLSLALSKNSEAEG